MEEPKQALTSFQKCIEITKDTGLKTRAYLMMSELYEKEDNREQEQKLLKEAEASLPLEKSDDDSGAVGAGEHRSCREYRSWKIQRRGN